MAWARAFYALAQGLSPGDRILTGMVEYGANYVAMLQVRSRMLRDEHKFFATFGGNFCHGNFCCMLHAP